MDRIIKADLYRYTEKASGLKNFMRAMFIPGFRYTYFFRKASRHSQSSIPGFLYRVVVRHYQYKFGYQITPGTLIGEGFYIGHWGHIIVSKYAVIGRNCNIAAGVTIGEASRGKLKGYPTIGDFVWMGTNCIIVGNIKIGKNVLIAPGAYVNFDVPDNSVVMGNPGQVFPNEHAVEGYITRIMNDEL